MGTLDNKIRRPLMRQLDDIYVSLPANHTRGEFIILSTMFWLETDSQFKSNIIREKHKVTKKEKSGYFK